MTTALMIIDMQMLMQERINNGREHVNHHAPAKIAALLAMFRAAGQPVIHIRHADADPASPLARNAAGYQVMPCAQELATEPLFIKSSSSAFASTALENYLHDNGITHLLVTGAVVGFCVNSTVRAGADLGFQMTVVQDAVLGFDVPPSPLSAQTIFDATMALLAADFATLTDTNSVSELLGLQAVAKEG